MLAMRPFGVGRAQPAFSAEESLVGRRGGLDLGVGTRTARSLALHHGEFGSELTADGFPARPTRSPAALPQARNCRCLAERRHAPVVGAGSA
jgi:hypothetical protein